MTQEVLSRPSLRRLAAACFAVALILGPVKAQAQLTFGVLPYLAAERLATDFAPLRDFLQQTTGQAVVMVSAPNYRAFYERTRAGNYDIVFTPPHFGVLAEKESNFQRIAMTLYRISCVIVVRKASSLRKLADLRGKTLAVPPKRALISILAGRLLRRHGLEPGKDVNLREFSTNQNSMAAPLRGDADAGATGQLLWTRQGHHESMRVLAESPAVPGFFLMAHPRLPPATVVRLRSRTLKFGDTAPGRAYLATTGHGAWLPIDDAAVRAVEAATRP